MTSDRVGQVWEVGDRMYLVLSIREVTDKYVVYDGLVLDGSDIDGILIRPLREHGEGQWDRMLGQSRVT